MSQIIFSPEQLQFINEVFDKSEEKKYGKSSKLLNYVSILDNLKSLILVPTGISEF